MTNIKQFGGNMWTWAKTWHEMISFGFKTLHIRIGNRRKRVGIYALTLQFQFNLGLSNIQRMCSFSKMVVKSIGFKSHSLYVFKHWLNVSSCYHMATVVPFLWMSHLAQMIWNFIYSLWWGLMISARVSFWRESL